MIKTLCGTGTYKNVVILTTLWDTVSLRQGELQEAQVRLNILQWLIQDGATFMRHDRTLSSAQRVLDYIFTLVPKIVPQLASFVPETSPQTQSASYVPKRNDEIPVPPSRPTFTRDYSVWSPLDTLARQGPRARDLERPPLLPGWRKEREQETLDLRDQFASPQFEYLDRWRSPRAAEIGCPPASTVFEPSGQNPTLSQLFQTSHETVREKELIAEINVLKDSNSELKRELAADAEKMQENQETSNHLQDINIAFVRIVKPWHINEGRIPVLKGEMIALDRLSARLKIFSASESRPTSKLDKLEH